MRWTIILAASVFSLASIGGPPALAEQKERALLLPDGWACGKAVALTPEVVAFMTPGFISGAQEEGAGTAKLRPFVAGALRDPLGGHTAVLYVQGDEGWSAYPVQEQAGFSDAYANTETGRAVLFSMINSEGPGQDYVVVSTADGFKSVTCGTLPKPETTLGTLDYMQIEWFAMDAKGHGRLLGSVDYADDGSGKPRPTECFAADTADGGKTWSVPKKFEPCIDNGVSALEGQSLPSENDTLSSLKAGSGM